MVGPTPEPTRSDRSESVTCPEEPGAAKAGAGSPRGQPSGRPGRSALGVPSVPSFKPAAGPTPRPGRLRAPGLATREGRCPLSEVPARRAPSRPGAPAPGQDTRPRGPSPGPRRRTYRAWPPCRPRRAGSPRGRAPPAGRCSPPRPPAARAAAAPCSGPWAPRPRPARGRAARRGSRNLRSSALRPRSGPPASSPAGPPPPAPPLAAAPPAQVSARLPPPPPPLRAPRSPQRPGRGRGLSRGAGAAAGEVDAAHSRARRRMQPAEAPPRRQRPGRLIWAPPRCPALPIPTGRCTALPRLRRPWSLAQPSVPQLPRG